MLLVPADSGDRGRGGRGARRAPRGVVRHRFVVVALLAAGVGAREPGASRERMFVSEHDVALVDGAAGLRGGTGVARRPGAGPRSTRGRPSAGRGAQRIGDGDLDAPIGDLGAGPELDALARVVGRQGVDACGAARERRTRWPRPCAGT